MQPHLHQDPIIKVLSGGVDSRLFCSCAAFPPAGHPNKPEVVSILIFADERTTAVTLQQKREGGFRWCRVATGSTRGGSLALCQHGPGLYVLHREALLSAEACSTLSGRG